MHGHQRAQQEQTSPCLEAQTRNSSLSLGEGQAQDLAAQTRYAGEVEESRRRGGDGGRRPGAGRRGGDAEPDDAEPLRRPVGGRGGRGRGRRRRRRRGRRRGQPPPAPAAAPPGAGRGRRRRGGGRRRQPRPRPLRRLPLRKPAQLPIYIPSPPVILIRLGSLLFPVGPSWTRD